MAEELNLFVWGEREGEVYTQLWAVAVARTASEARRYIRADKEQADNMDLEYLEEEPSVFEGKVALAFNPSANVKDSGFTLFYHED